MLLLSFAQYRGDGGDASTRTICALECFGDPPEQRFTLTPVRQAHGQQALSRPFGKLRAGEGEGEVASRPVEALLLGDHATVVEAVSRRCSLEIAERHVDLLLDHGPILASLRH